jgi:hypothetical protein
MAVKVISFVLCIHNLLTAHFGFGRFRYRLSCMNNRLYHNFCIILYLHSSGSIPHSLGYFICHNDGCYLLIYSAFPNTKSSLLLFTMIHPDGGELFAPESFFPVPQTLNGLFRICIRPPHPPLPASTPM